MSKSSDDESSDSSSGFLINPGKLNLDCSFFSGKGFQKAETKNETENESTDDEFENTAQENNVEIFSEVLKNLERSSRLDVTSESSSKEQSFVEPATARGRTGESKGTVSSNEINELLLRGENGLSLYESSAGVASHRDEEESGNMECYTIPKDGVKITLPGTSFLVQKKKRGAQDLEKILRNKIRANQILIEKVGLLCWLAYGFHLNRQINDPEVISTVHPLISTTHYPKNRIDLSYLEGFTKWFHKTFTVQEGKSNNGITKEVLLSRVKEKKVFDYKELVLLYIATLRAIGINCRLVISLCPPYRKLKTDLLLKTIQENSKSKSKPKINERSKSKDKTSKETADTKNASHKKTTVAQNSLEGKRNANLEAKKKAAEVLRGKQNTKKSNSENSKNTGSKDKTSKGSGNKGNEEELQTESKNEKEKINVSNLRQLRSRKIVNETTEDTKQVRAAKAATKKDGTTSKHWMEEDSDSDTEFEPKPKRAPKRKLNNASQDSKENKKNKKLVSSDEEEEEVEQRKYTEDLWAEVYVESEESWICVSITQAKVHCVEEVYKRARRPVLYIIAWNSCGSIKDVTRRYCPQWLTVTRKQRIDDKWWSQTVSIWKEKNTTISKAEDETLLQKELEQPLPKTVGECKGHPLYALARHLLKYEGLYPPDCVPLGHLKTGEAIYSRHCVHTLCSRETWLKKARVVKPNQEPYKIVKALPKYDKLSGMKLNDTALELFGQWQTMDYEPPEAKDGIVPRNEFGNVNLFKLCMLPKGTVHIDLPGLNRVARKLNIDCAPAVVGFNFGRMGAVPAFEGFVVCTEFEDTLREAWEAEQIEAAKRAREKREKRVYGNWKRLIHGLLIREKLAAKYEFSEEKKTAVPSKRGKQRKADAKKLRDL